MIIRLFNKILGAMLRSLAPLIIDGVYGGFYRYREKKGEKIRSGFIHGKIYHTYLNRYGAFIGEKTVFKGKPRFPHYLFGIFISNSSVIGRDVVIFQQVTIGANALEDHGRQGAPVIGDNVLIGAGAKIIGNVTIGDNCRIGANCVVVKDMPPNTTAVAASTRFIHSDRELNNALVCLDEM